jgi:hypothetical protein
LCQYTDISKDRIELIVMNPTDLVTFVFVHH